MADDRDLDDFFARKTKKKTKAKGKAFTTSTKIAQNVEQLQHVAREREHAHLQPAPEKPAVQNPVSQHFDNEHVVTSTWSVAMWLPLTSFGVGFYLIFAYLFAVLDTSGLFWNDFAV